MRSLALTFALVACGSRTALDVDEKTAGALADGGASNADAAPPRDDAGRLESCASGLPGPVLVAHHDYFGRVTCIDATEVTNAEYAVFLAANGAPAAQGAACAWNTTFVPAFGWPATGRDDYPVVNVDWCDARAFCAWTGKHLCLHSAPNAGNPANAGDPLVDEWTDACTGHRAQSYPYGRDYGATTCNGRDYGLGQATPVGIPQSCEGADPGLHGMSGNVWEWEDACDDTACLVRGGSFRSNLDSLRCDAAARSPRQSAFDDFGIRCCLD